MLQALRELGRGVCGCWVEAGGLWVRQGEWKGKGLEASSAYDAVSDRSQCADVLRTVLVLQGQ